MGYPGIVMKHMDFKISWIRNCQLGKVYIMLGNLFNLLKIQKMGEIKASIYRVALSIKWDDALEILQYILSNKIIIILIIIILK